MRVAMPIHLQNDKCELKIAPLDKILACTFLISLSVGLQIAKF